MVYHEIEAFKFDKETGKWSGPFVHFTKPKFIPPNFSQFYLSVWEDELDQSDFEEECKRKFITQHFALQTIIRSLGKNHTFSNDYFVSGECFRLV